MRDDALDHRGHDMNRAVLNARRAGAIVVALAAGGIGLTVAAAPSEASAACPPTAFGVYCDSAEFVTTGSVQTWTVPDGVTSVGLSVSGGSGGSAGGTGISPTVAGGTGGFVAAYVPVTPGHVLSIVVGAAGSGVTDPAVVAVTPAGGYGGGGNGGAVDPENYGVGAGGGGGSFIFDATSAGGPFTLLAAAGGGGGASVYKQNSTIYTATGGTGGTTIAGFMGTVASVSNPSDQSFQVLAGEDATSAHAGGGGGGTTAGLGGANVTATTPTALGGGGAGVHLLDGGLESYAASGGGGGGYRSGGSGGCASGTGACGGGGGGIGYLIDSATLVGNSARSGDGSVVINYKVPFATTSTVTASPDHGSVGSATTLTATVAPIQVIQPTGIRAAYIGTTTTAGPPSAGSVAFYEGRTSLGAGTVSNGVATVSLSSLKAGTHQITARYSGTNGYASSSSSAFAYVVTAPSSDSASPTPRSNSTSTTPSSSPTPTSLPPGPDSADLAVSQDQPQQGGTEDLTATGFKPGTNVDFWLHSVAHYLGSAKAGADGTATLKVVLPASFSGPHTVQATGVGTNGKARNLKQSIVIGHAVAASSQDALSSTGFNSDDLLLMAVGVMALGFVLLHFGYGRRRRAQHR
jgi:hypothetical protein